MQLKSSANDFFSFNYFNVGSLFTGAIAQDKELLRQHQNKHFRDAVTMAVKYPNVLDDVPAAQSDPMQPKHLVCTYMLIKAGASLKLPQLDKVIVSIKHFFNMPMARHDMETFHVCPLSYARLASP